jgi:hypothetical protein
MKRKGGREEIEERRKEAKRGEKKRYSVSSQSRASRMP